MAKYSLALSYFKYSVLIREYEEAPAILGLLIDDFIDLSLSLQVPPLCTRIREKVSGSSGVHEDYRGADFRQEHNGKMTYDPDQAKIIIDGINNKYPRNDGKLTCILHSFCHSNQCGPMHFHLQLPSMIKTLSRLGG